MNYLIRNGSIIDPARRVATVGDVLVVDGKVERVIDMAEMGVDPGPLPEGTEIIHAGGCVVAPGFTDLYAELGEPGHEQRETIATGMRAAVQGGFTMVCAMPNTNPVLDSAAVAHQVTALAQREGQGHVALIGAVTQGREGKILTEMIELAEAGCVAFSDAGRTILDAGVMRNALAYAAALDLPIMSHCEDARLGLNWVMHEGAVSMRLGLPGLPAAAEEIIIARDIALAEDTRAHLHICQVSTAAGVALIRAAKERGVRVTAEVSPHHLALSDTWVLGSLAPQPNPPPTPQPTPRGKGKSRRNSAPELGLPSWLDPTLLPPYDSSTRIRPPLRSEQDIEALIIGLNDGTIDAIASGHTPRTRVEKECEYGAAAPGISSLETALGLVLTLVHRGEMDLVNTVARLTEGPAQVMGRSPATLRPGSRADIVIFDPDRMWTVERSQLVSLGKNTPLQGQQLKGQVMLTMVSGQVAFRRGEFGMYGRGGPQSSKIAGIFGDVT
ncbi:dihydroorotase, multifunctional complex type [Oscillochloris trichoides DG-6]|uniref:Dihydroorotase n=1 Tax=Oscillochloris trichoides DG-6 TaxID=765420 RepID=E1IGT4_9CHLR|nr:dihydroorotase [Oscillochloris trichoides]EFO79610.1 dihydroorotase, multifunctional complex type [Oscillochloris trichoides DG-6]